jgi:hypothetical protein
VRVGRRRVADGFDQVIDRVEVGEAGLLAQPFQDAIERVAVGITEDPADAAHRAVRFAVLLQPADLARVTGDLAAVSFFSRETDAAEFRDLAQ